MPRKADVYVHRIGRTGRAGAKGTAISLIEAHDFEFITKAARYTEEPIKARVISELRPQNKAPKIGPRKKKLTAKDKAKAKSKAKPKIKNRIVSRTLQPNFHANLYSSCQQPIPIQTLRH